MLARHYWPEPGTNGSSCLTSLGHSKDSLWSVDFFRCESLILKSHWVMVVMDQFSRRIVGFAAHGGALDGPAICRMFNRIVSGSGAPQYPSSDNDPLFLIHQWNTNLRILDVMEVKTVPYVPLSHPTRPDDLSESRVPLSRLRPSLAMWRWRSKLLNTR